MIIIHYVFVVSDKCVISLVITHFQLSKEQETVLCKKFSWMREGSLFGCCVRQMCHFFSHDTLRGFLRTGDSAMSEVLLSEGGLIIWLLCLKFS